MLPLPHNTGYKYINPLFRITFATFYTDSNTLCFCFYLSFLLSCFLTVPMPERALCFYLNFFK